ncbi:unnamed protein product [Amoebophrya sp. A25]|nr:unnamed protein product [Amoebophrya sp. A25]|eukprot:GSA25T00007802001.1
MKLEHVPLSTRRSNHRQALFVAVLVGVCSVPLFSMTQAVGKRKEKQLLRREEATALDESSGDRYHATTSGQKLLVGDAGQSANDETEDRFGRLPREIDTPAPADMNKGNTVLVDPDAWNEFLTEEDEDSRGGSKRQSKMRARATPGAFSALQIHAAAPFMALRMGKDLLKYAALFAFLGFIWIWLKKTCTSENFNLRRLPGFSRLFRFLNIDEFQEQKILVQIIQAKDLKGKGEKTLLLKDAMFKGSVAFWYEAFETDAKADCDFGQTRFMTVPQGASSTTFSVVSVGTVSNSVVGTAVVQTKRDILDREKSFWGAKQTYRLKDDQGQISGSLVVKFRRLSADQEENYYTPLLQGVDNESGLGAELLKIALKLQLPESLRNISGELKCQMLAEVLHGRVAEVEDGVVQETLYLKVHHCTLGRVDFGARQLEAKKAKGKGKQGLPKKFFFCLYESKKLAESMAKEPIVFCSMAAIKSIKISQKRQDEFTVKWDLSLARGGTAKTDEKKKKKSDTEDIALRAKDKDRDLWIEALDLLREAVYTLDEIKKDEHVLKENKDKFVKISQAAIEAHGCPSTAEDWKGWHDMMESQGCDEETLKHIYKQLALWIEQNNIEQKWKEDIKPTVEKEHEFYEEDKVWRRDVLDENAEREETITDVVSNLFSRAPVPGPGKGRKAEGERGSGRRTSAVDGELIIEEGGDDGGGPRERGGSPLATVDITAPYDFGGGRGKGSPRPTAGKTGKGAGSVVKGGKNKKGMTTPRGDLKGRKAEGENIDYDEIHELAAAARRGSVHPSTKGKLVRGEGEAQAPGDGIEEGKDDDVGYGTFGDTIPGRGSRGGLYGVTAADAAGLGGDERGREVYANERYLHEELLAQTTPPRCFQRVGRAIDSILEPLVDCISPPPAKDDRLDGGLLDARGRLREGEKQKRALRPPPHLLSAMVKHTTPEQWPHLGVTGWEQKRVDSSVLLDKSLTSTQKLIQLFGLRLDWNKFPVVVVSGVSPQSRAAAADVHVGDFLLLFAGHRIADVGKKSFFLEAHDAMVRAQHLAAVEATASMSEISEILGQDLDMRNVRSPDDALIWTITQKLQQHQAEAPPPLPGKATPAPSSAVASFLFLSLKFAGQYVQMSPDEVDLGFAVQGNQVALALVGGWASKHELRRGDEVVMLGSTHCLLLGDHQSAQELLEDALYGTKNKKSGDTSEDHDAEEDKDETTGSSGHALVAKNLRKQALSASGRSKPKRPLHMLIRRIDNTDFPEDGPARLAEVSLERPLPVIFEKAIVRPLGVDRECFRTSRNTHFLHRERKKGSEARVFDLDMYMENHFDDEALSSGDDCVDVEDEHRHENDADSHDDLAKKRGLVIPETTKDEEAEEPVATPRGRTGKGKKGKKSKDGKLSPVGKMMKKKGKKGKGRSRSGSPSSRSPWPPKNKSAPRSREGSSRSLSAPRRPPNAKGKAAPPKKCRLGRAEGEASPTPSPRGSVSGSPPGRSRPPSPRPPGSSTKGDQSKSRSPSAYPERPPSMNTAPLSGAGSLWSQYNRTGAKAQSERSPEQEAAAILQARARGKKPHEHKGKGKKKGKGNKH